MSEETENINSKVITTVRGVAFEEREFQKSKTLPWMEGCKFPVPVFKSVEEIKKFYDEANIPGKTGEQVIIDSFNAEIESRLRVKAKNSHAVLASKDTAFAKAAAYVRDKLTDNFLISVNDAATFIPGQREVSAASKVKQLLIDASALMATGEPNKVQQAIAMFKEAADLTNQIEEAKAARAAKKEEANVDEDEDEDIDEDIDEDEDDDS